MAANINVAEGDSGQVTPPATFETSRTPCGLSGLAGAAGKDFLARGSIRGGAVGLKRRGVLRAVDRRVLTGCG